VGSEGGNARGEIDGEIQKEEKERKIGRRRIQRWRLVGKRGRKRGNRDRD
jgi:hypothetical protein